MSDFSRASARTASTLACRHSAAAVKLLPSVDALKAITSAASSASRKPRPASSTAIRSRSPRTSSPRSHSCSDNSARSTGAAVVAISSPQIDPRVVARCPPSPPGTRVHTPALLPSIRRVIADQQPRDEPVTRHPIARDIEPQIPLPQPLFLRGVVLKPRAGIGLVNTQRRRLIPMTRPLECASPGMLGRAEFFPRHHWPPLAIRETTNCISKNPPPDRFRFGDRLDIDPRPPSLLHSFTCVRAQGQLVDHRVGGVPMRGRHDYGRAAGRSDGACCSSGMARCAQRPMWAASDAAGAGGSVGIGQCRLPLPVGRRLRAELAPQL